MAFTYRETFSEYIAARRPPGLARLLFTVPDIQFRCLRN